MQRANDAVAGGLGASQRSAAADGLARNEARELAVMNRFVLIEHPNHVLSVRHHVRRRHVLNRPDVCRKRSHPCPAEAFLFGHRQHARVTVNPPLAAAEGNVHHRTFPRHPRGQRANGVDRLARIKPDTAFAGPPAVVVLHAIPPEHLHRTVIHSDGQRKTELSHRFAQKRTNTLAQSQFFGHCIKLLLRHFKRIKSHTACPPSLSSPVRPMRPLVRELSHCPMMAPI